MKVTSSADNSVREYKGVYDYLRTNKNTPFKPEQVLAVVWFDGSPDLYVCDGQEGIEELKRMYRDDWGEGMTGHVAQIDIFTMKEIDNLGMERAREMMKPQWTKTFTFHDKEKKEGGDK